MSALDRTRLLTPSARTMCHSRAYSQWPKSILPAHLPPSPASQSSHHKSHSEHRNLNNMPSGSGRPLHIKAIVYTKEDKKSGLLKASLTYKQNQKKNQSPPQKKTNQEDELFSR